MADTARERADAREPAPLLELDGVTRRFPGVVALDDVNLDIRPGEIHALVGANGAGKSTLIQIVAGVLTPDDGTIRIDAKPVQFRNPGDARRAGIVTVHQEGELFGSLSVAENMALSCGIPCTAGGFVRRGEFRRRARAALEAIGEELDVDRLAEQLTVAQRQITQIAAAVQQRSRVILFDEPTSALSERESRRLFERIRAMRTSGMGVIYVSHRHDEIFRLADRISVLRDGRKVLSCDADQIDHAGLVAAMVGEIDEVRSQPPSKPQHAQVVRFRATSVTTEDGQVRDVSLECRGGEVLGIYGLVGAGRTEFAESVFGIRPLSKGSIQVDGKAVRTGDRSAALRAKIALVPDDRLRKGVFPGRSVGENLAITALCHPARGGGASTVIARNGSVEFLRALGIRMRSVEQPAGELSGGNQQKVVLGRWFATDPAVLILDEPTRGIDVHAKTDIHRMIRERADAGSAVMLISSELSEVLDHADRILVFREGSVAAEFQSGAVANDVGSTAVPSSDASRGRGTTRTRRGIHADATNWGLICAVGMFVALLWWTAPQFGSWNNLSSVLSSASVWVLLSLAAATVIVAGGIDISIGSLMALAAGGTGIVLGLVGDATFGVPLAIGVGLAIGACGGAINAGVSRFGGMHPIVVTLGTLTIYRGVLITLTGGEAITDLPRSFLAMAGPVIGRIDGTLLVGVVCALTVHLFWVFHRSGRYLFSYGSNPRAARYIGVSQTRAWLTAFVLGGMLVGAAGVIELARSGSMQSVMGTGFELRAIAAAVIGGASITGGRGTVLGVVLGALLLSLLQNALVLWQVAPHNYDLILGGLIVTAVVIDRIWRGRSG